MGRMMMKSRSHHDPSGRGRGRRSDRIMMKSRSHHDHSGRGGGRRSDRMMMKSRRHPGHSGRDEILRYYEGLSPQQEEFWSSVRSGNKADEESWKHQISI